MSTPIFTSRGLLISSPSAGIVDKVTHYVPGAGFQINGHTYVATSKSYSVNDDISADINKIYGAGASLASWETLKADLSTSTTASSFLASLALPVETPYGYYPNLYVSKNGSEMDGSRGRFFISNFTGSDPSYVGYASFDNIIKSIHLGSYNWSGQALVSIDENAKSVSSVAENTSSHRPIYIAQASDSDGGSVKYSLSGGSDASLFKIDPLTGSVFFYSSPDYEKPKDAGSDNVYDITVQASNGHLTSEKNIAVIVADIVDESNSAPSPEGVFFNPSNGHYYEFVKSERPVSWAEASDNATNRTLSGVSGYLATITSDGENSFISSNITGFGGPAWLGASALTPT